MLRPGIPLADLAAGEYRLRRETALRKVAACQLDRSAAEALLLPWLALAIRLGALPEDLPPGLPALADLRFNIDALADTPCVDGTPSPHSMATCHSIVADAIAPRPRILTTLVDARDAAVSKALAEPTCPKRAARAHDLSVLGVAMGLPAYGTAQPDRLAA